MNVIVRSEEVLPTDIDLIFGPIKPGDEFVGVDKSTKMRDLVAALGFFRSKKEATNNGFGVVYPDGYNEIRIGKRWKNQWLYIWNPMPVKEEL